MLKWQLIVKLARLNDTVSNYFFAIPPVLRPTVFPTEMAEILKVFVSALIVCFKQCFEQSQGKFSGGLAREDDGD